LALTAQIFEPFAGWHHTKYVSFLLPPLIRLLEAGQLERIVLTTTTMHRDSAYFADLLSRYESKIELDVVYVENIGAGHIVSKMLLDSVKRNRPDYLVSTSANNGALTLALRSLYRSEFRNRQLTSIGVIHNGFYESVRGLKDRAKDAIHRFSRRFSPWSELHVVNPLLHSFLERRGGWTQGRLRLLPDPVDLVAPVTKAAARERLQIPVDGTYIGQVGKSDPRKAIPELLAAFRAARLSSDQRLLLAGSLHPPYKTLIEREYADLVREQRLILIDRYLRHEELHLANSALDVAAVTYYTDQLSGNMLAAIAAERPVLADKGGYTGMVIDKFDAGYAVDIRDHDALTATINNAMSKSVGFHISSSARRLLQFHDPQNFADTLLRTLYQRLGVPTAGIKTWDWALGTETKSK
jgi:glycosyltransferase involved in cell wall biosynthesis